MPSIIDAENEIVMRLTQGDEGAFCQLYAAYKTGVLRFVLKYVKSKDFAEDIFQDAFAVVWQSRQCIHPDTPFSAYLFTIVKNRVLNSLRSQENETKIKEAMLSEAIDSTNDTQHTILENDLLALIEKAKSKLTPKQRKVFELSRDKQLSHVEIAEKLNITKNTVKEHISISLKVIRIYLIKYAGTHAEFIFLLLLP